MRGAGVREASAQYLLERLHQMADHPQLLPTEPGVIKQCLVIVDGLGQNRKGRLDRLDKGGIVKTVGYIGVVLGLEPGEWDIRLRRDALQYLTRVQLVLHRQYRLYGGTRPAHLFGQQGRTECAELFVIADHAACTLNPGTQCGKAGEAVHVEPCQPGIARKTEQVKPGMQLGPPSR